MHEGSGAKSRQCEQEREALAALRQAVAATDREALAFGVNHDMDVDVDDDPADVSLAPLLPS